MKIKAFSLIEVVITLFLLSSILIGCAFLLKTQRIKLIKKEKLLQNKDIIKDELDDIIKIIQNNKSDVDSCLDPIWEKNTITKNEVSCFIISLSGLVDLNFLPDNFYKSDYIKKMFYNNPGKDFYEFRKNNNMYIFSYEDIKDFVDSKKFEHEINPYNLCNINIANERVFKTIANKKNVNENFFNKRKSLLLNNQYIQNETEAILQYGIDYNTLLPYVTVEAPFNVNFMDKDFLMAVLSLKEFHQTDIQNKVNLIINTRENEVLDKEKLCNILGISNKDLLYYYLGVRTFFWEIKLEKSGLIMDVVLYKNNEKVYIIKEKIYETSNR